MKGRGAIGLPLAAWAIALAAVAALAAGCKTRLWEGVDPIERPSPIDLGVPDLPLGTTSCVQQHKVDLLFMVDNSGSMDAMQAELRNRFPEFFQVFYDLAGTGTAADLHIGVITSDYGSGPVALDQYCDASPGGQRGELQALGVAHDADCHPPVGANFVRYQFGDNGVNNLPPGQDLNHTFACMASVGSMGCGNEHPLESTYAALHIPENAGFVRDDALLVIVFLTNEDDCSAPPDTDLFNSSIAAYGAAGNFRCTRYGIVCGNPPMLPPYGPSGGPLANCQPAPNLGGLGPRKLFDVSRYINLFTQPRNAGGIKDDPGNEVVLIGIAAPSEPVETILANPTIPWDGRDYALCPMLRETGKDADLCMPTLQRSCHNATHPVFFGDPAVRLNAVVSAAENHALMPICNDDYSGAMQGIARTIVSHLSDCCLPEALPPDGTMSAGVDANCIVEEVIEDKGVTTVVRLPACTEQVLPCWRIERQAVCAGSSPQSLRVVIDSDASAPVVGSVRATCGAR